MRRILKPPKYRVLRYLRRNYDPPPPFQVALLRYVRQIGTLILYLRKVNFSLSLSKVDFFLSLSLSNPLEVSKPSERILTSRHSYNQVSLVDTFNSEQ